MLCLSEQAVGNASTQRIDEPREFTFMLQVSGATDKATHAQALCTLARVRHAMGDLDQARQLYDQSLSIDENLPLAHYGMAQTLIDVVRSFARSWR